MFTQRTPAFHATVSPRDGWTRELRLIVPVAEPDRWQAAAPIFILRLLNFLTGDRWSLGFRARPRRFANVAPTPLTRLIGAPFDDLALFSGGLDSLIGALMPLRADALLSSSAMRAEAPPTKHSPQSLRSSKRVTVAGPSIGFACGWPFPMVSSELRPARTPLGEGLSSSSLSVFPGSLRAPG